MKLLFCILAFLGAVAVNANDFPKSEKLNQLWLSGNKAAILTIANDRLVTRPDDILGLLLKFEYEVEFLRIDDLVMTADKMMIAAQKLSTPRFTAQLGYLQMDVDSIKRLLPLYTPEMIAEDLPKAAISGKPLGVLTAVRALEQDGLLDDLVIQ